MHLFGSHDVPLSTRKEIEGEQHIDEKLTVIELSMKSLEQATSQGDVAMTEKVNQTTHCLAKAKRPALSYVGLIAQAIQSTPDKRMRLTDIYQWMTQNYPYFRALDDSASWRNSIRHNLSLNECFVKVGRDARGKGHYWRIHPANEGDFADGDFRRRNARMKVKWAYNSCTNKGTGSVFMATSSQPMQFESLIIKEDRQIYDNQQYDNCALCPNGLECGYEAMTSLRASLGALVSLFGIEAVTSEHERKWIVKSRGNHRMAPSRTWP